MITRLVLDVGNTSITYGVFSGKALISKGSHPTADYRNFHLKKKADWVVYASVVPAVDPFFRKYFKGKNFIPVTHLLLSRDITIKLPRPQEVGIDRLVNAFGVSRLHSLPAIIIDFGTATTFDIVNKQREYLGGLIAPGLNLSRIILHEKTAKLPLITLSKKPKNLIGTDTVSALQSGLFFGYQSMIDGIIKKLRQEKGLQYRVVATGGYSSLIGKNLEEKVDSIDPELTLKSLNLIGSRF